MLPRAVQFGLELNAGAVKARRDREYLELRGVKLDPGDYLSLLLAEGEHPERAQKMATDYAEQLLKAEQQARATPDA